MAKVRVPYIIVFECIACSSCAAICPEVFAMDDQKGYAVVVNQGGAPVERIQEAMDSCPTACIHWED